MSDDGVYLRRVRVPIPMLEELARQAADSIAALQASAEERGHVVQLDALSAAAAVFGVSIDYILDELERRVRASRTPEKSEGA